MKKIGIIGCGAIGSELARSIDLGKVNAKLVSIYDVSTLVAKKRAGKLKNKVFIANTIHEFLSSDIDIVVESASQDAVRHHAKKVLDHKMDLMMMSIGALLDRHLYHELLRTAEKHGVRIFLPTGAIAGIDAIRSVKKLLSEVRLTTTKNPKGLKGAPFFNKYKTDLTMIKKPTLIYEGKAIEAVKLFSANVNVAAALSLAGMGGNNTMVRIVADPKSKMNVHEITAKGKFGEMRFEVKNFPSPTNPKTSYLAVLSAIECLRSICDDKVHIGT